MIQVFKIMHGINDMDRDSLFTMKDVDIDLRGHNMKIQKQHARLTIRKNSFTHRVVDHWNMLPKSAVEAASINIFKNEIDAFFATKYDQHNY